MKTAYFTVLTLCGAALLTSCGNGKATTDAEACDSSVVVIDTAVAERPEMLPDSALISAAKVKHCIDPLTSDTDGNISLDDLYGQVSGVLTFRGGPKRDADFGGRVSGRPASLDVAWSYSTEEDMRETKYGQWRGGTGWTGQPLYFEWPDDNPAARDARREIAVGSLASYVYFIDFESGKSSRNPIFVDNPVKGTICLDPSLNGGLYVGLGIPAQEPMGTRAIDLCKDEVTHVHGHDPKAWRGWHAYDSSPLRLGDFLFHPSENGTLYKFRITGPGRLKLHSAMRYTVDGCAPGIEASMAAYRNYGYLADNHGNVICVNLNTLKPIWHTPLGDDIDATPVVCIEGEREHPYVYVGCEVDRSTRDYSVFVKLDGLSGDLIWERRIEGQRYEINEKHFDAGYFASALPGRGNCSNLMFNNVVKNTNGQNGSFIALDRSSGNIVYETPLSCYAWSSPVGFLNENDEMFIVTADCAGYVYLIDGKSGEIICRKLIGHNFESSPAVVGNSLVIGSRGNKIYRINVI